jgi:tol-pal system protein YbgF
MTQWFRGILWRRGSRTAPLWLMGLSVLSTACVATKGDVRRLQMDLAAVRARQDSLHRDLMRQDRVLLDTLRRSGEFSRDMQSRLTAQIRELKDLMEVLQQLMGQTQQRIAEARSEVERLQRQQQTTAPPPMTPATDTSAATSPDELYRTGIQKYNEKKKSAGTARLAFEELLREFPNHERAPDAQYHLAETYYLEGDIEQAWIEFDRVVEMYPSSPRAPIALFRAGFIAEEKRERTKARQFYTRLRDRYPRSEEARQAAERLRSLRE